MHDPKRIVDPLTRVTRERVFAKLVWLRLVIAPVMALVAGTFVFFEETPWRGWMLFAMFTLLVGVSIVEAIRYRRGGLRPSMVAFNLFAMAITQIGICAATGGLFSPVIPSLMIMTVFTGVIIARNFVLPLVLGLQLPAVWLFAIGHALDAPMPSLVPAIFGPIGALEDGPAPWIAAFVYTMMLIGLSRVSLAMRGHLEAVHAETIEERDRSLALHAEQSRALTTLTAEIAHELKNPLTSVKGLASLLAKDLEGKPAERLAVLRREVDRMQGVLEEFLNFSRPLVPLAISEVDVVQLAHEVVRLHEGTASDRAIAIAVDAIDRVWLRCDPRKVRQIAINLVQNALEASPDGGELVVRVSRSDRGAEMRVLDRGAGIDPDVAERIFDAGVTTKEQGSGLGLAVARSLARQHGGDLTLANLGDGGCEAVLFLPRDPVASEAA